MSGKHWTSEEIEAWRAYFRTGQNMPAGRTLEAALRKVDPRPRLGDLAKPQYHAMSCAVFPLLQEVTYKGEGCHTDFIERVQICAVEPWKAPKQTDEIFDRAVSAAREALHANS